MSDYLPLPLPTVPGKVHGIVSMDPVTVQCDGCGLRLTWRDLVERSGGRYTTDRPGLVIICGGIDFNPRLAGVDDRRLCRDCAKQAGWDR